jgi:hypothetical protein
LPSFGWRNKVGLTALELNDREQGRLRRVKRLAFIELGDFLAISVANVARALGLLLAIVAMDGGAVRAAPDAAARRWFRA